MKKLFAGVVVLVMLLVVGLTTRWSRALQDAPKPPTNLQTLTERFWTQWQTSRPSEAVHMLSPDQGTWDQAGRAADDFQANAGGKCLGHSEITRRAMGPNLEYVCYLAHYNPLPVRVEMLCYKASDTWTVIGFRVDGNTTRWMNEAASFQLGSSAEAPNAGQ